VTIRDLYARMSYPWRIVATTFGGACGGLGLFMVALFVYLIGDRHSLRAEYGSLWDLFKLYELGGITAGAVTGALLPIAKSLFGGLLVGTLAALPLAGAVGLQVWGPLSTWDKSDLMFVVVFSAVLGGIGAVRIRKEIKKETV
jgi:hypothetical protein